MIALVSAAVINTLIFPQSATVAEVGEQQAYLDGVGWANGTTIAWSPPALIPGSTYTKSLKIQNNANLAKNITFVVQGLPVGWSETWPANGTVLAFNQTITDTLSLIVPSDAIATDYSWSSYILAT